jgi:hypothetical protein
LFSRGFETLAVEYSVDVLIGHGHILWNTHPPYRAPTETICC